MAIVQYARKNEVVFIGNSLFPDRATLCFLGDVDVTNYCQTANHLYVSNSTDASKFRTGVGVINTSSNAFARVIATSNTSVLLDQNYITVGIGQYGTTPLAADQYKFDSVVCQTAVSKLITNNNVGTVPGMPRNKKNSYDNGLLHQYGVYKDPWKKNKDFTQTYKILFPTTGWYQFSYQADEQFSLTIDGVNVIPLYFTGRRGWEHKEYYKWMTAGAHTISFRMLNKGKNPQSVALIIRGPGNVAAGSGATITSDGNGGPAFEHGYFNGSTWTSGYGTKYRDDPINGIVIFQTRDEPKAVTEYKVVPTFVGRVQYYDSANNVVAIRPEYGIFNETPDNELSTLRLVTSSGTNYTVSTGGTISSSPLANVKSGIVTGNIYPTNSSIVEIAQNSDGTFGFSSNTATISSYEHRSGLIVGFNKADESGNTANLTLQGNVNATFINQPVRYSDIEGNWHYTTITSINSNNEITIATDDSAEISSNCAYSVGNLIVDDDGVVAGIFNVPEGPNNKLTAGKYKFKLTDSANASLESMSAETTYTTGTQNKVSLDTVVSIATTSNNGSVAELRKSWSRRGFDPVAQVFFVPGTSSVMTGETAAPYGYWVSSIDLWFKSKSFEISTLPVTVRIVQVINDLPTNNVLTEVTVPYKDIKVSNSPYTDSNGTVSEDYKTKFKFPDPVYLAPDTKYAITISSDSPFYEIYVANGDETVIGTSTVAANSTIGGRIKSREPYTEQFYKSQNASVWTPLLNTDLMFRINKCKFNTGTTGSAIFKPSKVSSRDYTSNVNMDAIIISAVDSNQQKTSTQYSFKANNALGEVTNTLYVEPNKLIQFGADLASSTKTSSRRRVYSPGDKSSAFVEVQFSSTSQDTTPVIHKENLSVTTFENYINDSGISTDNVVITSGGRHSNTSNIQVTFSAPDELNGTYAQGYVRLNDSVSNTDIVMTSGGSYTDRSTVVVTFSDPDISVNDGGQKANAYILATGSGSITASDIYVDIPGSGYINAAPTITFSGTATGKVYSNAYSVIMTEPGSGYYKTPTVTISEPNMTSNATATIASETDSIGGNALARYITKRVDLAEGFTAGDLRVYLDCVRPSGTNINVYYKVRSPYDSEQFESKKWQLMNKVSDIYSPDQKTIIELEFNPTVDEKTKTLYYVQDETTYPIGGVFNQFAIKVTLTAANPTVVPIVTNLAAMAIPAG